MGGLLKGDGEVWRLGGSRRIGRRPVLCDPHHMTSLSDAIWHVRKITGLTEGPEYERLVQRFVVTANSRGTDEAVAELEGERG